MGLVLNCFGSLLFQIVAFQTYLIPLPHKACLALRLFAVLFVAYDLFCIVLVSSVWLGYFFYTVCRGYHALYRMLANVTWLADALYYDHVNQLVKHALFYFVTALSWRLCVELHMSHYVILAMYSLSVYYQIHIVCFSLLVVTHLMYVLTNMYLVMYHFICNSM